MEIVNFSVKINLNILFNKQKNYTSERILNNQNRPITLII